MAYSQEELNAIIAEFIIDNNLNMVTPAKVRQVLYAISSSLDQQNAASVSASDPLSYDAFTNNFSIPKADASTDGFLSKEDWAVFNEGGGEDPGLQEVLGVSGVATDVSVQLKSSTQPYETNFSNEEISAINGDSIIKIAASGLSIENLNELTSYLSNSLIFTNKSTGYQSKLWMLRNAPGFAEFKTDPDKPAGSYIIPTRDELITKADLILGKVPQSQLPSYVDDIIEGYLLSNIFYLEAVHTTVIPAEAGKIYIDITTGQKNKEYRYSGSAYIQITNGLIATSDDVPEGAANLFYTAARALLKQDVLVSGINIKTIEGQSLLGSGNVDLLKSDVGLSNVDNTSDLNKPISTATQSELDEKQNAYFSQKYAKTFFTNSSGLSLVGVTPTFTDGKMRLISGTSDFSKYITIDGLKNTDENVEIEIIFKAITVASGSNGIAIGKRSFNTWSNGSIAAHFNPFQNIAYLWDPTTSTQIANKGVDSTVANDVIKLKYTQIANNIVLTWYNLTQNKSGQISVFSNLAAVKNFKIPNSSNICIWNLGGTIDIISIKQNSFSNFSPNVLCIGDSKTVGFSSTNNSLRWASNIGKLGSIIVNAGDGDRTVETTQTIDYTKLINAKYAILNIGRNDLASSVSSVTWQANYQNIVTQLQGRGTIVYHLLPIPETVVSDQSTLKNWIVATYGAGNCIDPSIGWSNATMLSADNVHPNEVGHAYIAKLVLDSGLIPTTDIHNLFPKNNEGDFINQSVVANTANYIPYSNGNTLVDSDIYRVASGRYAQGTISPVNYGVGYQSNEIRGTNYGVLSLGKIGNTTVHYFSSRGDYGFIGANIAGVLKNGITINQDGSLIIEDNISSPVPNASARLEVKSTTQGFLPPRMTTTQKNAISSPAEGLIVYDSTLKKICMYNGTAWENVTSL